MSAWPVASEPWADAPRARVAGRRADEMAHLYVRAGMSLRQVAETCGVSRETVRRELGALGVTLRPPYAPWNRIEIRRDEEGRVRYGYEVCRAEVEAGGQPPFGPMAHGEVLWRMDIFGAPALRGLLVELGMFDGRDGRPPIAKLETQDGWHITASECAAALGGWRRYGGDDADLARRVRLLCEDAGWDASAMEVGSRVRLFNDFVVVLVTGAESHGLIVT